MCESLHLRFGFGKEAGGRKGLSMNTTKVVHVQRTIVVLPRKKQKDGTWKEVIRIKDPVLWELIKEQVLAATREAADRWFQMKEPEEIRIQLCSGGKVNAYAAMQYEGIEIDGIQITEVAQGVRVLFPYDFPFEGSAKKSCRASVSCWASPLPV